MTRSYQELIELPTFNDRFLYLKLDGIVGAQTFAFERYLNQTLYRSDEWGNVRNDVIIRDDACDLGVENESISYRIIIHHINPITISDILNRNPCVFDMNNLITTTLRTHNAIHYGVKGQSLTPLIANRKQGDTTPWKVY